MAKRCNNCFAEYEEQNNKCPHCGYVEGESGKELYYLSPGTSLCSPIGKEYIIGEVVGAGGFGIIYKAWDESLRRVVAIKEYFPTKMVTRSAGEQKVSVFTKHEAEYRFGIRNFLQEATIMLLCRDCENVCNSYDKFQANGTAYMVMEYLGKTLKEYVKGKRGEGIKEAEIYSYIIQTLQGVEQIHKRGVLHLDIAPDNIYVMLDGQIKISDFGAAKAKNVKKDDREVVLKPGFAPPEQYHENAKIGPEADIYAVGATLYWLLTGQVPLEASDRMKEDDMEEPSMLAMVPVALNNITMRAMAVNPELRYKNSKEFITALRKEKERSIEEEIKKRKRKRRRIVFGVIFLLLAIIAAAGYFGVLKNKIWSDSIVVWIAVDNTNAESSMEEKERYEAAIKMFCEEYPQLSVEVIAKNADYIEEEFLNTPMETRPDLIETTGFDVSVVNQLSTIGNNSTSIKGTMLPIFENQLQASKTVPLGFYVDVIYAETGKNISDLNEQSKMADFLGAMTGYFSGKSTQYILVQETMAGRYQILESETKGIYLAEEFGVYSRSKNKEKAANALLEYLLTDAAQDILHVQNQSTYMPVSEEAWKEFINVYSEFEYLEESLDKYRLD